MSEKQVCGECGTTEDVREILGACFCNSCIRTAQRAMTGEHVPERHSDGQWKKGQSGNPGGRPRGGRPGYLDILKEALTPAKWKQIVVKAIDDAIAGNRWAREWVSNYAVGRPAQIEEALLPLEELSDELQLAINRIHEANIANQQSGAPN